MRTTLTIDDDTFRKLKEIGHRTGQPFKAVVNEALRAGIAHDRIATPARRFRTQPVSLGDLIASYNLDKALQLSDRLGDEEIARNLLLRK